MKTESERPISGTVGMLSFADSGSRVPISGGELSFSSRGLSLEREATRLPNEKTYLNSFSCRLRLASRISFMEDLNFSNTILLTS